MNRPQAAQMSPVKRKLGHPEEDLQVGCVGWFRRQFPIYGRLLYANLNALAYTGQSKGAFINKLKRLKAMGLEKGIPDLMLAVRRGSYSGFFCELKVPGKNPKPEQEEMIALLTAQGYYCCVSKTVDEFMHEVKRYMRLDTVGRVAG